MKFVQGIRRQLLAWFSTSRTARVADRFGGDADAVARHPTLPPEAAAPRATGYVEVFELLPGHRLRLLGWCAGTTPIAGVEVRINGQRVATLPCHLDRQDVAAAHPGLPGAANAGFEGEVAIDEFPQHVNLVEVVVDGPQGVRVQLLRQHVLAPEFRHRWAAPLDARGVDEDEVFYFPIATSRVARGGAEGIQATFALYESRTVKVGIRVQILYLRTTLGAAADYVFDPDFVADKSVGDRLIAEDSLNDVIRFAVDRQMPVLFTLNGGIWADAACASVEWDVNDALECDESLCQWNEHNQVMPDDALSNLPGSMQSPELGRCLSLNVYMRQVRHYKKRNLQRAATLIRHFAQAHPHLFIGVNLDADVYVNPFYEGAQWYDYNPATLRQFRHWLRGDGPYEGEGDPDVPDLSRYRRARPYALADIDELTGRRHGDWSEVDAPRAFPTKLRSFWKDPWVGVWEQFRRHLVQLHYDELSQWVAEAGIDARRIYSSQGFMPPGELIDPLPVRIDSPAKNYDTGGMSIEGSVPTHGRLGAIIYGDSAINRIKMEGEASLFAEFRHYSPEWAVVEHNTGDLTQARRLGTCAEAYRSLCEVANYGGRFISSMAWNGSPGDTVGTTGFLGYTSLRRSPLERAMQDFMLMRADLPRHAPLWTFGAGEHVDGDGWIVNGQPVQPLRAGMLVLALGAKGSAALTSPPELAWRVSEHPAVVIEMHEPDLALQVTLHAAGDSEAWEALGSTVPLGALARDTAGIWLPVANASTTRFQRLRLTFSGPPGASVTIQSIALYPARPRG